MFKRFLFGCAALICASGIFCGAVQAESKTVEADGEYRLGDNDTRSQAKDLALADATKAAVEKVAVFVESYTKVNDFQLTEQEITSYTNGSLKIESKSFDFVEDGLLCKAHIVATVDIDENAIREIIEQKKREEANKQSESSNPSDVLPPYQTPVPPFSESIYPAPVRDLFNVVEYNGHFYAVVDEGMDWRDADVYCRNYGGHLVTINSPAEQKFVQGIVFTDGKRNAYWLGGYQSITKANKWYWVDDTPFEYTNWAEEQPDNLRETALMMYRNPNPLSDSSLGEWNDLAANGTYAAEPFFGLNNFGLVIEWEARELVQYN